MIASLFLVCHYESCYNMHMVYLALGFGLLLLMFSANYFVKYAATLAQRLGLKKAIFGAVVVAIGTSLPEFTITIEAALNNSPAIVIGNILGSNIANIGLILGVLLLTGKVTSQTGLKGRSTLLLVISLIFVSTIWLKILSWPIGLILLTVAGFLIFDLSKDRTQQIDIANKSMKSLVIGWLILISSLVGVIISSRVIIESSISIANTLGISVGIIAATIIAVGTSLPELIITLVAIKKKEYELAVGNIIGSNLFNLVLIGGVGAIITNLSTQLTISITIFFILFTVIAHLLSLKRIKTKSIYGVILIALYILYVIIEYSFV